MSTHAAVVTLSPRAPLEVHQVPSHRPRGNEVRVRNEWTTSGPLDLHKADGALLVKHPEVLGEGVAGTVVEVGDDVKRLQVGDKVRIDLPSSQDSALLTPRTGVWLWMALGKGDGSSGVLSHAREPAGKGTSNTASTVPVCNDFH